MRLDEVVDGVSVGFNGETLAEPCYGLVPENMSFRGFRANIPDLAHPAGVRDLAQVAVTVAAPALSPIAQLLSEQGLVAFELGAEPLATLTFDHGRQGRQGRQADLRPVLPLVFQY